jgi:diguanylate cyclase (GGDEF)-like protein
MCRDNDASNPPVSLTAEIKARLHAAYDILPGIFLFRADGTEELVFANQDALALYQCKSFCELREKIGTHFSHFLQPDDYLPLSELTGCSTAKDTPHRFYSYEYRTALGHLRRVEVTLQQGTDADLGPLYYMSLIDADTRRNAYETDTLTGLPGMHAFFRAAVAHAKRNLRNGTFLQEVPVYFNITNFRKLNTSYGIARGDECLCTVAHILREHFPGRLIGRLAADNFAMLAGSSDVTTRVSAACRAFADYIQNSGIELKAGIRFYDTSENSAAIFQYGFDQAKLACNTVKSDANHCWAAYTEEMGWHIDDTPFHAAERAVIKEGKPVRGALGHCLVRGTPHAIRASKFPIYLNGGIAGLMGYFEDLDDAAAQEDLQDSLGLIDQGTGLMNYRGMLMAGTQYQVNYRENKEDYLAIILDVPAYDQLRRTDQRRGDLLLARLKEIITRLLPQYWSIAYIGSSCFVIFQKRLSETECRNRIFAISNAVHDIHEVDGYPCSLHLQYAFAHGSEGSSLDSLLHLLTERLCDAEEQHYSQSLYVGDRVIFQREAFDQLEEPVIISDTETHEVLYCNPAALLDSGLPADTSYQGRKCYELYRHQPAPCDNCDTAQLSHGTFLHNLIHNPVTGHDYYSRAGLIPWRGKNCRFTLLTDLTRYSERSAKRNDLLYHKTMINDALRLAMCESDPDKGIERMLLCIGTRLHADRVLLMEEDSTALHLTYDWAANDLTPLKGTLAPIPRSELAHIYEKFIHHPVITIRDLESYWEHTPGAVPHLPDLKRLTISRISLDDHAYGYIEVVNPPEDRLDVSSLLCSTLSRFIAILLRNRDMQNNLRHLGRIDQLTGVLNRRGLTEYLPKLPDDRLIALVFADVNGLKRTNDTLGHEAGDHLIQKTADALKQEAGATVFRMGGDEFLLIKEIQAREEATALRASLKQRFRAEGISVALGTITLPTPIEDIDAAIAEVDRLMYDDKTRHYRSRHEARQ